MKRKITITMLLIMTLSAAALLVGRQAIDVNAQDEEALAAVASVPARDATLFGMIGLARGQTARLNVVNLRSIPAADATAYPVPLPVPCAVRLRFLDQRGNTIARALESILPGDGAFLDLPFHEAIPQGFQGRRFQIRAIVQVVRQPEDARRCATISTMEIFDNETGRTSVLYPEEPR
jgi:hypothetical protein